MASGKAPVSDEEFVVIWQKSKYTAQVAQLCGYTSPRARVVVSNRAGRLRAAGVPLKRLRARKALNVKKLAWMAERAAAASQEGGER